VLLLVVVSFLWGGNIVSIKISNEGIPPILAATIRSLVAAAIVWAYARTRHEDALMHGADFKHGLVLGLLFAADFVLVYLGPVYTNASRAVIFVYIHPFLVALGAHFLIRGDALTRSEATGLVLAFLGLVSVFGSHSRELGPDYWIGDLFEIGSAFAWAFTTIYIKKFIGKRSINHYQTLFAQLFYSVPFMLVCWLLLEYGKPVHPTIAAVSALGYQTLVVAGFS